MNSQLSDSLRYHDELYRYACKRTNPDDAEDIVQYVFLRVAEYKGHIRHIQAFLHHVTTDAIAYRGRELAKRATERWEDPAETPVDTCHAERIQAVTDALGRLSPREQAAIRACYFDDLSSKEAAELLGVTCATARKRLSRAVEKLRALMIFKT